LFEEDERNIKYVTDSSSKKENVSMSKKKRVALALILGISGLAFLSLYVIGQVKRSTPPIPVGANRELVEHSKIFKRCVEKVSDNIHVAIGFGIANSIMIEGTDGLIIVDTMTTREEAAEVLKAFRKISRKPIKAIIYTHSHPDHILGAEVFAAEGDPEIYAHLTTHDYVNRLLTEVRPCIGTRSMRMYGNFLAPGQVLNVGIGPHLGMTPESTTGYRLPTRTFSDILEAEVAGVKLQLVFAPGETADQIFVWLPEQRVLIAGDNFYWTFPNLYTIRGTLFRDLKKWYQSLDKMRDLGPAYLVPCHTRPIAGKEKIRKILTDYRDAIQFVHDQAIRGMNMGLTPDELAQYVKLPPHLAEASYLQPFYGKVSWSVRAMFSGNLGWFDGDSANLQPLTRREQAELMARLAGGEEGLLRHARVLLREGEFQAALQLTGHMVRLNPDQKEAKEIRIKALTALAEREQNPNARHYYLSEALEIRDGFVVRSKARPSPEFLKDLPLMGFFESLAVNLDPDAGVHVNQRVGVVFPDQGEAFIIHVRYGVAEIRQRSPKDIEGLDLDLKVIAEAQAWKEMLAKLRNPIKSLASFEYEIGNAIALAKFMRLFAPPKMKLPYEPLKDSIFNLDGF
jgi:alkyl sulfatase BDS1-like metallo-beta-lactamase superfamily hydrolase